ncbi:MAG: hypothetical protein C4325_00180 [Blastocatellia bacterium]
MKKKIRHYANKLLALLLSSAVILILLALGEIYCRYFTRVNFLDNTSGLFTAKRFGNSYGNTPNFSGISFGAEFQTDEEGLRIVKSASQPDSKSQPSILVMGDSVVFGPALDAAETIPGRLQAMMPDRTVMNAGVIGYDTTDYLNATRYFVDRHPEIDTVLLFVCLNDVNDESASEIRGNIERRTDGPQAVANPLRLANDFLRSRSKLYLLLKNALVDTQKNYFDYDAAFYSRGPEFVAAAIRPVAELNRFLKSRNINLRVYLLPYEFQLRASAGPDVMRPQSIILSALEADGLKARDLTPDFTTAGIDPSLLFLYGDPMHLSSDGTLIAAESVCRDLPDCKRKNR